MIVYVPKDLPVNSPLLISCHGSGQDAKFQKNQANYEEVADKEKFVVVYPDGEGKAWDTSGDKDVTFMLDIIDAMSIQYKIDKNRVYLSGFSMGASFTYHCAVKIADNIACFAPTSGYRLGVPITDSSRPVPILHVHGTGDGTYSGAATHIDAWVKRNKCNQTPEEITPYPEGTNSKAIMYK